MNVVYDLLGFQSRDHGERGIARYVLHLGLAIERARPGLVTEYLMHPDLPFPAGAEPLLATGRVVRADRPSVARDPSGGGVFIAGSPFETFNQPSELVLPAFARTPEWRSIAVIHDLIPAIFPGLYLNDPANVHYYGARLHALSAFDRFLTNSQATTDDAVAMLGLDPSHLTMIGAGADDRFRPPPNGHEAAAEALVSEGVVPGLRSGYILFPTGIDPRKNVERTIEAYGHLPEAVRAKHQLVLACRLSDPDREHVDRVAAAAGVSVDHGRGDGSGEMLVTGYVSDEVLCRLYQAAHLVVFPSYYEGFGLPALEAMKCGAPVICANATSLREVQPIAEARFDPMSVPAIAVAIDRALADDDLRDLLRTQELPPFTWDLAAERAFTVIDELSSTVRVRQIERDKRASKPRLAVFGPLPPQPTDTAGYTFRLLEHLRQTCDVTVFVDTHPLYVWAPAGVEIEGVENFDVINGGGGAFDRVLVMLGDDRYHLHALDALERGGATAVFHSARLTSVYSERQYLRPSKLAGGTVGRELADMYPGRYRHEVEQLERIPAGTADRFGILMAAKAADRADQVIVHSDFAASMLTIDTGVEPTVLAPFPCPPANARVKATPERTVVAAFGVIDQSRQPEKLIDAWAKVEDRPKGAVLRFVGPIAAPYRSELAAVATESGVAESVVFTNEPSDAEIEAALDEACVAVHLAATSDGSCSAVVADLLANGVPTIATAIGPTSELPDDIVVKVDASANGDELGELLTDLLADEDRRRSLTEAATAYANTNSYAQTAKRLVDALFADSAAAAGFGPSEGGPTETDLRTYAAEHGWPELINEHGADEPDVMAALETILLALGGRRRVRALELASLIDARLDQDPVGGRTLHEAIAASLRQDYRWAFAVEATASKGAAGPPVLVAATPRSGNTLLQRLFSELVHYRVIAAPSVADVDLAQVTDATFLQIHAPCDRSTLRFVDAVGAEVVTIARHPLDVLISMLHFHRHEPEILDWLDGAAIPSPEILRDASPTSDRFLDWATGPGAARLLAISHRWWRDPTTLRIRYEDLTSDTPGVLAKLFTDLGVPQPPEHQDPDEVRAGALLGLANHHRWRGTANGWRELLPMAQATRIQQAHRRVFNELGYSLDAGDPDLTVEQAEANWNTYKQ